jgi:hypothetical protein
MEARISLQNHGTEETGSFWCGNPLHNGGTMGRIRCPYFSNVASARLTLPTAGIVKGVCNNAW